MLFITLVGGFCFYKKKGLSDNKIIATCITQLFFFSSVDVLPTVSHLRVPNWNHMNF